jgi:hypothetical protein
MMSNMMLIYCKIYFYLLYLDLFLNDVSYVCINCIN